MEKKKKLLIATDCFLPRWDGVSRFLYELLPYLCEQFEVTVLAPEFPGELPPLPVINLIRFPIIDFEFGDIQFSSLHYFAIKKVVAEHDLIFTQTIGPIGAITILAAKAKKKHIVSYIHSIDWELTTKSIGKFKHFINIITKSYARFLYRKCDLLLMPFHELQELYRVNGINTKSKVIFLGTDTAHFKPPISRGEAKQKLGINPDTIVLGFVGRLAREKNLITLYRAFRIIEKKHENIKLLVVGKGIKELDKEFSSDKNVMMVGATDDVLQYLHAMDVYVLPSLTETTSLSTVEAMATGLPVIATPVGYVKYYIKEKHNGMFFPFRNSLVLSLKLDILIRNAETRQQLGKNARETAVKLFSFEKTANTIVETLLRL